MPIVLVPYHLDEHLPDLTITFPPGTDVTTVVATLPPGGPWTRMAALYDAVATEVARSARAGAVPVVASGDCTTAFGTLAGLQRAGVDASVVWFDAHGDVQSLETTTSGYLGGMPLRMLVGYRPELICDPLGLHPIAEDRAVLVDARDLDPAEVDYLAAAAIRHRTVEGLAARDLPTGPLLLHLDLDVLDPDDLPGLLFPVPGGPAAAAVLAAVRRVVATGRVVAVDLACTWRSGPADPGGVRARLVADLLTALPGSSTGPAGARTDFGADL
jgi:arginase